MNKLFSNPSRLASLAVLLCTSLTACSEEQQTATTREADNSQETPIFYQGPAWSPDGTRIAFYSNQDSNFEIYTIRPDATDLQRLTHTEASDTEMSWSSDGTQIAFNFSTGIYAMNADGSDRIPLTDTTTHADRPRWSPRGKVARALCFGRSYQAAVSANR